MIAALNLEAYRDLPEDHQRDVDAFVEHLGLDTFRTFKITGDLDQHGLGIILHQHRQNENGQAFVGMDDFEIAWEKNEYLRMDDGRFAHVARTVMN